MDAYQVAFGKHVRFLRTRRELTQEEVAHRAGIHVTYLSGVERGVRNPSLRSIRNIARALGVHVGDLFAFEGESQTATCSSSCYAVSS
ncbi:MAG: helix-turn-helix transcriptional regulator [Dehalococcoidia bacterium]|nr:helix-turn-helix transcriptional regulator [Dehalococcoidia bacterium]